MQYVEVNSILAKFHREIKNSNVSEMDLIEWIGEALDFIFTNKTLEHKFAILEIEDFTAELPKDFVQIEQLGKIPNTYTIDKINSIICDEEKKIGTPDDNVSINRCDSENKYVQSTPIWQLFLKGFVTHVENNKEIQPIQLATDKLFLSNIRDNTKDNILRYKIAGTTNRYIKVSFEKGSVLLAYVGIPLDDNGMPLIPNDVSTLSAISYYIKWKLAEHFAWEGREGYLGISDRMKQNWLHYVKQATNNHKIPDTIDELYVGVKQTQYKLPGFSLYKNFFRR